MNTGLRFQPYFHVEPGDEELVFLVTEATTHVLHGRVYQQIAPLLDGTRTADQIADALVDRLLPFEVTYAIERLRQRGFVIEGPTRAAEGEAMFWCGLGIDPNAAHSALASRVVSVLGVNADTDRIAGELRANGIAVSDGADFAVVATDDYARDELAAINRDAHAGGRPWMLVKPVGIQVWIGPIFEPGATACWECLRPRLLENRQAERYAGGQNGPPIVTSVAAIAPSLSAAAALTATELARYLALAETARAPVTPRPPRSSRVHPGLAGRILTFNLLTHETAFHTVIRRPHCAVCGSAREATRPAEIQLQARPKSDTTGGGHRVLTVQDAHDRLQHLVSPITGIVNWMKPKEERASDAIHTYSVGHPFPVASDQLAMLRANLRYRAGGKGLSDLHARVSAIGEAVERYSCVWRGDEPVRRSTARALGSDALPLDDILQFSGRQFAEREAWNRTCTHPFFHVVARPLDPDVEMAWSAVWSLTHGRTGYVPSALCYYAHPDMKTHFVCWADSNGTASGATIEEAILQGAFELVERDAVGIWWYNRLRRAPVDVDSFELPSWAAIRREYARRHRDIWVIDLTTDLGIPVFAALSRRTEGDRPEDIVMGFGAHFDATVALTRAITEANELLPAVSRAAASGGTIYLSDDKGAIDWWQTCTIASEPYVCGSTSLPARTRGDYASETAADLRDDVERLVRLLAARGMETFVLDQTHPDIQFPVVRVIVPGLRHFWRRLGPGRLYDVPVRMGWLPHPPAEADMNPRSVFL
jgi:ribosomal protein S12 methylthiotransferase accessory factor